MKRQETYFVDFGKEKLPFRFGILSYMIFKDLFGKEITECKTLTDEVNYYFSAYKAGCDSDKIVRDTTIDDFIRLVDAYPENLSILDKFLLDFAKKNLRRQKVHKTRTYPFFR